MKKGIVILLITSGFLLASASAEAGSEPQSTVDHMVQVRLQNAKMKADWTEERLKMQELLDLYQAGKRKVDTSYEALDVKNQFLEAAIADKKQACQHVEEKLGQIERLIPEWEKRLERLLQLMPESKRFDLLHDSRLSQIDLNTVSGRFERLILLVQELNHFNESVTLTEEIHSLASGEQINASVLYFGFGVAYYVHDASGSAGIGLPHEDHWEWTEQPQLMESIKHLVQVRKATRQSEFIALPLISNGGSK